MHIEKQIPWYSISSKGRYRHILSANRYIGCAVSQTICVNSVSRLAYFMLITNMKYQFPSNLKELVFVCMYTRLLSITCKQCMSCMCFSLPLCHQTSWCTHMPSWLIVGAQNSPALIAFLQHEQSSAVLHSESLLCVTAAPRWPVCQQPHV